MKKSSFVAMMLGTVSGVLFALGMCMALLPQWEAMTQGIVMGALGIVLGLITLLIWRKMENKPRVHLRAKTVLFVLYCILGALVLGASMCLALVAESYIWGTIVGLVGILMLLSLIPIRKGLH